MQGNTALFQGSKTNYQIFKLTAMNNNNVNVDKPIWEVNEVPEIMQRREGFNYYEISDNDPDNTNWVAWVPNKEDAEKICKAVNNHDSLFEAVAEYYLYLQVESLGNIAKSITSDAKRAQLRNLISQVTGESNEAVQSKFEKSARLCKEAIKKAEQ